MATFVYVALNEQGKEVRGTIEADSVALAAGQVRSLGYFPTRIIEQKIRERQTRPGALQLQIKIPGFGDRIGVKELTIFTRQLATLIDAGLPLLRSLSVLRDQAKPGALRSTLETVADDIEKGSTFSEALAKHPKSFSKLYVNMIKAGEIGGVLEVVLERLAEFYEKQMALRRKIRSAMVYPILVSVVAGGIVTFLITFVIPTFKEMFASFGGTDILPTPTRILLAITDFIKTKWWIGLLGLVGLIILSKLLARIPSVRFLMDVVKLRIILFGPLVRKVIVARFARTLGTLINSGVPILQALAIVKDSCGNEVVARAMVRVHDSIREGESMARPLQDSKVFPPMVVNMVDVGEETGALDNMLIKVADTYDEDIDAAVAGLTSMLEPLLIVCMGGIVGFIVISMFLPLIRMAMMIK